MKKLLSKIGAGLLIVLVTCWSFLSYPATVLATAFPDSDSFDTYTSGADLTNLGIGWGEAWQAVPAETSLQVTNTSCQVGNCVKGEITNADYGNDRNTSADVTSAYVSFYAKNNASSGSTNVRTLFQATDSTLRYEIRFCRAGGPCGQNVQLIGTGAAVVLGNWDDLRWHFVEMEIGTDNTVSTSTACAANQVKAQVSGGTGWSACTGFANNGAVQNVNLLNVGGDGSVQGFWDEFNCPCAAAATASSPRRTRIWMWRPF